MKLYFFRHAIAHPPEPPEMDDAARTLTPKGIERTKRSAQILTALGVRPVWLYSSPLRRAHQTADLLAPALGVDVLARPEVGPGFSVQAVEMLIAGLGEDEDVLFVGHEPDLSTVVSAITGGGTVAMKKGGLARVDVVGLRPLRGVLVWLLPPRLLARKGA